ncbi:MAG: alpha/beta hydrolase, partial [Candidatus Promineifilaceae bacterium]
EKSADEPAPTEAPLVEFSAESRTITFNAGDGLELLGTFYPAGGLGPRPTVVLLHMLNSNRTVWEAFASELNANGYNALALDMRGHGETGGEKNWEFARADHLMVMGELVNFPEVAPQQTVVIGASIGSNIALILGKDMPPLIKTVVLLSPGLDYRGVTTKDAIGAYGDRPILIVASSEDSYSADSARQLADLALNSELIMYDGASHGTNMFGKAPTLSQTLLDWLNTHVSN